MYVRIPTYIIISSMFGIYTYIHMLVCMYLYKLLVYITCNLYKNTHTSSNSFMYVGFF